MRRAIAKDVKIMAYPILRKLGLAIDVFYVNDPDDCRKIFNKYDTVNGMFTNKLEHYFEP